MDIAQSRVASIALAAVEGDGFVLAGGYAIAVHGIGDRPSDDIDLFTNLIDPGHFAAATHKVTDALSAAGWVVEVARAAETFARLTASRDAETVTLDLGVDYRRFPPAVMTLGPVLSLEDAAGSKMSALYGRGEVRDYIDVYAVAQSGAFSPQQILALGDDREATPMDRAILSQRLLDATHLSDTAFAEYGVDAEKAAVIRSFIASWGHALVSSE
ncbi:MAG: hypothetical protein BGO26_05315 [Actinobacteria bacterium 69-20]|nr:MAG: hypothetical protein BGO26_05315 [Actinobacteria bacterium 69-20]